MTIYYLKQDDTIWGCGDPECCGEYYEEIKESFVKCNCDVEVDADHLHACNGGGPVLKWREAKKKEVQAFSDGYTDGYSDGWEAGIEWQKKREADLANRLFKPIQDYTVHELVHQGYTIIVDGEPIGQAKSTYHLHIGEQE